MVQGQLIRDTIQADVTTLPQGAPPHTTHHVLVRDGDPGFEHFACLASAGPRVVAFERLQSPSTPPTPQVFAVDAQLIIQATFRTPCEPYDATATVTVNDGGALQLIVRGDATGGCPMDIVGTFFYRATINDPPVGSYAVRAVHTYADAAWQPDSVDFGTVVLP
jgi:hypothetical protein